MDVLSLLVETIGDRIKRLRGARGLSLDGLRDVLVASGASPTLTRAAVQKWESGDTKNMKNETFVLLYKALGTDGEYLLWGDDRRPPRAPSSSSSSSSQRRA